MSDRYQSLAHNPIGKFLVKNLGLPNPPYLERWEEGVPLVNGTVLLGAAKGSTLGKKLADTLKASGIKSAAEQVEGDRYKGLLFDATGIDNTADLVAIANFFTPVLRSLKACGRVVVIGTPPEATTTDGSSIAQRALEGFVRSLAKEVGRGGSANLVYVGKGAEGSLGSTLEFLLSPKSAYVSGQVVRLGATDLVAADKVADPAKPLAGKVALVTGASRGLGEARKSVV